MANSYGKRPGSELGKVTSKLKLKHVFFKPKIRYKLRTIYGEQGWRSGESTRLPPMWAGFDSEHGPYVG